jgi:hypothetical protein
MSASLADLSNHEKALAMHHLLNHNKCIANELESSMGMKTWRVRVHTKNGSIELGQVHEESEELARCAALSKYGIHPDDDNDPSRKGIREDDDFDVGPA